MRCKHLYDIPDYVRGTITDEDRAKLDTHLLQCSSCRTEAQAMRALFSRIDADVVRKPDQTYWTNFRVHVNERIAAKKVRRFASPWIVRLAVPALSALLLFFIAKNISWNHSTPNRIFSHDELTPILAQTNESDMIYLDELTTLRASDTELTEHSTITAQSADDAIVAVETNLFSAYAANGYLYSSEDFFSAEPSIESLSSEEAEEIIRQLGNKL